MNNDIPSAWNNYDFSKLNEAVARIHEFTRPAMEALQSMQAMMRPIVEAIEQYKNKINFEGIRQAFVEAARPLTAIRKLGEAQFVCWDYMSSEFVDAIVDSENTNKTLRELMVRDRFQTVNNTIEKSLMHPNIQKHHRLYSQSVNAYKKGYSDLAVTGLTSVFDGLLSDISKNPTHKLGPRVNTIKEKIEKEEFLEQGEFAMLTLVLTFEKTLDSFTARSDFKGKEPKTLNRHWIAHGRSARKKTKLDCAKMINLIYGLLLIEDLESTATLGSSCENGE